MKVEVDSLIYILKSNPPRIVPCMVVEKIVSIKSDSQSTIHMISSGGGKKYQLENIKSPWFTSLDETRTYLMNQASEMVEATIAEARKIVEQKYNKVDQENQGEPDFLDPVIREQTAEEVIEKDVVTVELEDGIKARVQIPEILK